MPWVAVLVVSVIPVFLIVLPFNTIINLDAFLIALSMFIQIIFYVYHRHGKYGYYATTTITGNIFRLPRHWAITTLVVMTPMVVDLVLVVSQGLVVTGIFLLVQAVMFGVYGLQVLVERKGVKCCKCRRIRRRRGSRKVRITEI